ncbi:hypothetical protein AWB80_07812 [Caballeronia pedi]|uniref:Uncharacterized protein n=1 Tax=Caballeronia pedi TaxID=1777141 RepID=A0A158DZX3_9BURK|nr:hypothetical protein [Caballeronia pedi]SAL00191.1 hypothetical protein AWB80_07812 [Caballeronia pedi]
MEKFTLHDVHLGEIYYRYLRELAREHSGKTIRYGELVARAKAEFPDDPIAQNAIPTSIGNRLLTIEVFCTKHGLPNLACLAVNGSGGPGEGYKKNWEEEKRRVAEYDWSEAEHEWAMQVSEWRAAALPPPPRVKRTAEEAGRVFTDHWRADAASGNPLYPNRMNNAMKDKVLKALEKGDAPAVAFEPALLART